MVTQLNRIIRAEEIVAEAIEVVEVAVEASEVGETTPN
jgi:hypothetical protein